MSNAARTTKDEAFIPLEVGAGGAVQLVSQIRSTQLAASVLALRARGHFDAYLPNLPAPYHEAVLRSAPGTWLPIEVGVAHYRAAQALALSVDEQVAMGTGVAERIQNGLLGTLVRLAKTAGVTPWMGLEYFPRLWQRTLIGGGVAVYKLGPKEARIECHGAPELAELTYFRNGFRGMFASSGRLFCQRIYVTDLMAYALRKVIAFRISWA
jgi:hypothetical protein